MKRWLGRAYVLCVVWVMALVYRRLHPSMGVRRALLLSSIQKRNGTR